MREANNLLVDYPQQSHPEGLKREDLPWNAVLPSTSSRPRGAPWPLNRHEQYFPDTPVMSMSYEEMMAPSPPPMRTPSLPSLVSTPLPSRISADLNDTAEYNWACNGVARIADAGFRNPSWIGCIVHFASREEFQIMWRFGNGVNAVSTCRRVGQPSKIEAMQAS